MTVRNQPSRRSVDVLVLSSGSLGAGLANRATASVVDLGLSEAYLWEGDSLSSTECILLVDILFMSFVRKPHWSGGAQNMRQRILASPRNDRDVAVLTCAQMYPCAAMQDSLGSKMEFS